MSDILRLDQSVGDLGDEILPGIRPRQYQIDAAGVLSDLRTKGVERGLVNMATGLGKTVVGALDINNFLNEVNDPEAKILFLTHRNEIIDQAWDRLSHALGDQALSYYYLQTNNIPSDILEKRFVFASFQMFHRGRFDNEPIRELFDREQFRYLLTDEAHHATAPTFQPTLEYFRPRFSLGLTATPNRTDNRSITYIFGREVYRKTLPEGIAEGHLARPHYVAIAPKVTLEFERSGSEKLEKKLNLASIQEICADIEKRTAHLHNPKILVYTSSVQEAEAYAEYLPNARAIHSGVKRHDRQEMIEDFRVTRPSTLTSIDIMSEGIDVPDVDVIVLARETASESVFLQQIGRGLRRAQGKEEVLILDYVANSENMLRIARLINGFPGEDKKHAHGRYKPKDDDFQEVIKTITAPTLEVKNATFEFDESVLDLIKIIQDRNELNALLNIQTPEASIAEYIHLREKHGQDLDLWRLQKIMGKTQLEIMLSPFGGKITKLRAAVGDVNLEHRPEMITISDFSKQSGIYYGKVEATIAILDIKIEHLSSSQGVMSKSFRRDQAIDIIRHVRPVDGVLPKAIELSSSQIETRDAHRMVAPNMPYQAFKRALVEMEVTLHKQLTFDGKRVFRHSFEREAIPSVKEYLDLIPVADYGSKSVEDIAHFVETDTTTVYKAMFESGIEGECRRSPSSNIVHIYFPQHDVADIVSWVNRYS
jgi:superfamily II DNA or RNA helicase